MSTLKGLLTVSSLPSLHVSVEEFVWSQRYLISLAVGISQEPRHDYSRETRSNQCNAKLSKLSNSHSLQ
jgi:hypothetical protein